MKLTRNNLALIAILLLAALLRLTRVDLAEFKGDEGANCMVMLGMVRDRSFPLLGPPSSEGGYHFGPAMYYILYPAFQLSLDPRVASVVIASINVLAVYLSYRLGKELFNEGVGLIASALFATSPIAIIYSLKFWNYDLQPFAVTSIFYSLARVMKKDQRFWAPLLASLALAIQLHATALALIPAILVVALASMIKNRIKPSLRYLGLGVCGYVSIYLPVLYHEIGSNFKDTGLFIAWAFQRSTRSSPDSAFIRQLLEIYGNQISPSAESLRDSYLGFGTGVGPDAQNFLEIALFIAAICVVSLRLTRNVGYLTLWTWALTPLPLYFLAQFRSPNYYTIFFPVQYLIIAVLLENLSRKGRTLKKVFSIRTGSILSAALTLFIVFGQIAQMNNFYTQIQEYGGGVSDYGSILMDKERAINYIVQSAGGQPFRLLYVVPRGLEPYRYLLKINNAQIRNDSNLTYLIIDPNAYNVIEPAYVVTDPEDKTIHILLQSQYINRAAETRSFGLITVYKIVE